MHSYALDLVELANPPILNRFILIFISKMKKVYLSFGGNLGNHLTNFHNAFNQLKQVCKIVNTSFLYKTDPMYNTDQDFFINGALLIETKLNPEELLGKIKEIELV